MNTVDRQSPTPLYEQIKLILRNQILSGHYPPGSQLPSEAGFCALYGVSRITVVRALSDLENEGLIQRQQGKGTIVSQPRFRPGRERIMGFSRHMQNEGNVTRSKLLSAEVIPDSLELARIFRLPLNKQIPFMRIRRLRFVGDTPAVIMNTIVTEALGKRLLEYDLETSSFYQLYEEIWGLPVVRNETSLTPIVADSETAALMNVKVGSPHYLFRGFSYLEGNQPVELCLAIFRGNLFSWSTVIYRLRDGAETDGPSLEQQLLQIGA